MRQRAALPRASRRGLRQTGHADQHDRRDLRQMPGGEPDADASAERMADQNHRLPLMRSRMYCWTRSV